MITKEEYLIALDVVLKYHEQIKAVTVTKTLVKDWLEVNREKISGRLYNVLVRQDICRSHILKSEYIEDIKRSELLSYRHAGLGTWFEFKRIVYPE